MIVESEIHISDFLSDYIDFLDENFDSTIDIEIKRNELKEKYNIDNSFHFNENQEIKECIFSELAKFNGDYSNYFHTGYFNAVIFQMQLENGINNIYKQYEIDILSNLRNHTNCDYHFENVQYIKERIFQIALELFYVTEKPHFEKPFDDIRNIVRAARYLKNQGFPFEIRDGHVQLSDATDKLIFTALENLVLQTGALNLLKRLVNSELAPYLNIEHSRYMIHRHKSMGNKPTALMVPYNLLFQLAVKNIKGKHPIIPKDSNETYQKVRQLSIYYTACLGLQKSSVYEDMFIQHKDIPTYIVKNNIFDIFFYVQQWNPAYCIKLTKGAFSELFQKYSTKRYSLQHYMSVMLFVMQGTNSFRSFTYAEIKKGTALSDRFLTEIMQDISHLTNEINPDFHSVLEKTNFYDKPLIKIAENKYLLISPIICGFSFYQVLYRVCRNNDSKREFDRHQGEAIESFIRTCLFEKQIPFYTGYYQYDYSSPKKLLECDLILEGKKHIAFLEIKKRPLPDSFEQVEFFDLMNSLAEGIIPAQIQAFRHKTQLTRARCINLHIDVSLSNGQTKIVLKDRIINCISLVSQEYGFLADGLFGQKLLQVLTIADFKSDDPDNMKKLKKINQAAAEIKNVYTNYANGMQLRLNEIYHDFTFRTWQQLMYAIDNSTTADELIDCLIKDTFIIIGTNDYYSQLFNHIRMEKQ